MSDQEKLKVLLQQAYDEGFRRGNGLDSGCSPEDFGQFDEWWERILTGDLVSALADLPSLDAHPSWYPGTLVEFQEGEFIVESAESAAGGIRVTLQDRTSYERQHQVGF